MPTVEPWTIASFGVDEVDGFEIGLSLEDFGTAVQTFVAMRRRDIVTVDEIALAFNTAPDVVCAAINETFWASIDETEDGTRCVVLEGP